jgi:hypothetical protein
MALGVGKNKTFSTEQHSVLLRISKRLASKGYRAGSIFFIRLFALMRRNEYPGLLAMSKAYSADMDVSNSYFERIRYRIQLFEFLKSKPEPGSSKARSEGGEIEGAKTKYFVYWKQGFETAPAIVRACHRQLTEVLGSQLVSLSDENLNEYLELPVEVRDRCAKHVAHMSDIIRVGLLAKHGGVWLDATTWVAENPEEYLSRVSEQSGFFAYRWTNSRISSWLMVADSSNYVTATMYEALCAFWKENTKLVGYFMFHDLFECLYFSDPVFKKVVDSTPFEPAAERHILQRKYLFSPYDQDAVKQLLQDSPIQKITYKTGKHELPAGSTFEKLAQTP